MSAIYHRRSIRFPGYDYAQAGYYFITITAHKRLHLFGEIVDGKMITNGAGRMIERLWHEIANDFPHVALHESVIMPNHIHGIIQIQSSVGADSISALDVMPTEKSTINQEPMIVTEPKRAEIDSAPTLSNMIQSFKRHTTLRYIKMVKDGTLSPFDKRIWQCNFYEHIIRNDADHARIAEYIVNNPLTWGEDRFTIP